MNNFNNITNFVGYIIPLSALFFLVAIAFIMYFSEKDSPKKTQKTKTKKA